MKAKRQEWLQAFFILTGFLAFMGIWGRVGYLEKDNANIGQAVISISFLAVYIGVAFTGYRISKRKAPRNGNSNGADTKKYSM